MLELNCKLTVLFQIGTFLSFSFSSNMQDAAARLEVSNNIRRALTLGGMASSVQTGGEGIEVT